MSTAASRQPESADLGECRIANALTEPGPVPICRPVFTNTFLHMAVKRPTHLFGGPGHKDDMPTSRPTILNAAVAAVNGPPDLLNDRQRCKEASWIKQQSRPCYISGWVLELDQAYSICGLRELIRYVKRCVPEGCQWDLRRRKLRSALV